jgi:hypothetical protein
MIKGINKPVLFKEDKKDRWDVPEANATGIELMFSCAS